MSRPSVAVAVHIPRLLSQLTGGQTEIAVSGESLGAAIADLVEQRPGLRKHLYDENGALRRHVRLFHNESWTRDLDTALEPGDAITILHSVSGGA